MIRKAASLLAPKYKDSSVCEACGEQFICGASICGCWCTKIDLTDEVRAELKTKYKRCLCKKCLEELSENTSLVQRG